MAFRFTNEDKRPILVLRSLVWVNKLRKPITGLRRSFEAPVSYRYILNTTRQNWANIADKESLKHETLGFPFLHA